MTAQNQTRRGTACRTFATSRRAIRPSLGILLAALVVPTKADAQDIDGSFRLALEGNVLRYNHVTLSASTGSVEALSTSLGLPGTALGVALGYGVTPNVVLGGRLLASTNHDKIGETAVDGTSFAFLPHVEYVFSGGATRPFISANLGYSTTNASTGGVDSSTSAFMIGPGVGIHGFATSTFSIDAGVTGLLQTGTAKSGDVELDANGYSVLLTVAVSGWLGSGTPQPTAPGIAKPSASEEGAAAAAEDGRIESSFTLDLPNTTGGGVRIAIQGDPRKDAGHVHAVVTFLKPPDQGMECTPAAFEVGGTTTELADVHSSSRGGFGSALSTQGGSLPFDTVGALIDRSQEAWLVLCGQRVLVLAAAKRRVERFVHAFRERRGSSQP